MKENTKLEYNPLADGQVWFRTYLNPYHTTAMSYWKQCGKDGTQITK